MTIEEELYECLVKHWKVKPSEADVYRLLARSGSPLSFTHLDAIRTWMYNGNCGWFRVNLDDVLLRRAKTATGRLEALTSPKDYIRERMKQLLRQEQDASTTDHLGVG